MSRNERIKEELGWLKVLLAIFAAVDVSLIGWVAKHFASGEVVLVVIAVAGILFVTLVLIYINRIAYLRIRELEEL